MHAPPTRQVLTLLLGLGPPLVLFGLRDHRHHHPIQPRIYPRGPLPVGTPCRAVGGRKVQLQLLDPLGFQHQLAFVLHQLPQAFLADRQSRRPQQIPCRTLEAGRVNRQTARNLRHSQADPLLALIHQLVHRNVAAAGRIVIPRAPQGGPPQQRQT